MQTNPLGWLNLAMGDAIGPGYGAAGRTEASGEFALTMDGALSLEPSALEPEGLEQEVDPSGPNAPMIQLDLLQAMTRPMDLGGAAVGSPDGPGAAGVSGMPVYSGGALGAELSGAVFAGGQGFSLAAERVSVPVSEVVAEVGEAEGAELGAFRLAGAGVFAGEAGSTDSVGGRVVSAIPLGGADLALGFTSVVTEDAGGSLLSRGPWAADLLARLGSSGGASDSLSNFQAGGKPLAAVLRGSSSPDYPGGDGGAVDRQGIRSREAGGDWGLNSLSGAVLGWPTGGASETGAAGFGRLAGGGDVAAGMSDVRAEKPVFGESRVGSGPEVFGREGRRLEALTGQGRGFGVASEAAQTVEDWLALRVGGEAGAVNRAAGAAGASVASGLTARQAGLAEAVEVQGEEVAVGAGGIGQAGALVGASAGAREGAREGFVGRRGLEPGFDHRVKVVGESVLEGVLEGSLDSVSLEYLGFGASAGRVTSDGEVGEGEVGDGIERGLRDAVRSAMDLIEARRPGSVTVRLNPEDLGTIEVVVRQVGGRFDVDLSASDEGVRASLAQSRGELMSGAEGRGLNLGSVTVSGAPPSPASSGAGGPLGLGQSGMGESLTGEGSGRQGQEGMSRDDFRAAAVLAGSFSPGDRAAAVSGRTGWMQASAVDYIA